MRPKQITKKLYVDAGCLMIGDPCYYRADPNGVCKVTRAMDAVEQDNFPIISEPNRQPIPEGTPLEFKSVPMYTGVGMGVVFSTGGDGVFDCTFDIDESGRIVKVTISLD